ncbi:hypothetical protein GCM10027290_43130 [Micromonospora sonneratiae]|uniref:Capsular polysaccharide biosynthesis protein n=1 Tax=Micromonospora sonneratiae TaxID=1184706 RepID=A0ABW3YK13_9ACTN
MDLLDLLKLMFRRWYVTAPVVILTLGAALALGTSIQPEYKTEAAVLLVPPTTAPVVQAPNATPQPGNPWLRVGENAMAQAVQISVSAHDARQKIVAAGGDPGYEIGLVNRSSILTIEVTAPSRATALATVTAVTKLIEETVAGQQAQYHPRAGEQITIEVLDPGLNIVPSRSNVLRAQIVVAVIGVLLAAASAVTYDAIQRRRSSAKQHDQRRGRTPLNWNTGQAAVRPRRPSPQPAGHAPSMAPSHPVAHPQQPADVTQQLPVTNLAGPDGSLPPGRDSTGPKGPAERGRYPQADDTVLLTTIRRPVEDSTTP